MTNYPPYEYLERVLTNCPKAGMVYVWLWKEKRDDQLILKFKKDEITFEFSWKAFKDNLMHLKKQKVLDYSISKLDKVAIVLRDAPEREKVA
jgi:hypothetical protein